MGILFKELAEVESISNFIRLMAIESKDSRAPSAERLVVLSFTAGSKIGITRHHFPNP